MATSKAQIKATNKYIGKAYDRLNIVVPRGRKSDLEAHVGDNQSVNGLVNDLLKNELGMTEAEWRAKPEEGASRE